MKFLVVLLVAIGWYGSGGGPLTPKKPKALLPPKPKVTYQYRGNLYWLKIEEQGSTRVYRGYGVPQWMRNPFVNQR